jgi:Ca-activated chloride channel family protein
MKWTAYSVDEAGEGPRRAHLLVSAQAEAEDRQARSPVLLNLVLDRSGSMTGPPLAAAVEAAQQLVAECGPADCVGLVVFDAVVEQRLPIAPMDTQGKARLRDVLGELVPGRGTQLHQAVRVGASALRRLLMPEGKPRLVLLTDGEPSVGPESRAAFAGLGAEVAAAGVSLHPVGLGAHYLPEILTELARPSGNAFGHADGPEGLPAVMGGVFALIHGEAAQEAMLEVRPRAVRMLELRHQLPASEKGGALQVKVGGVPQEGARRVLFTGIPVTPEWGADVVGQSVERGDTRLRTVEVCRVWPDSAEGRLVRSVGVELELLEAETQAWQLLMARDGRAKDRLELAEARLRALVTLDARDIPTRWHLVRLGDLRLALEKGEGNLALLTRRSEAAAEVSRVSQIMPFAAVEGLRRKN